MNSLERLSELDQIHEFYEHFSSIDLSLVMNPLQIWFDSTFDFMLTKNCNLNCEHCICWNNKSKSDFNLKTIKENLWKLAKLWVKTINLTWWEIFLYIDQLPEIFYNIGKYWIVINQIKTNMLHSERFDYYTKVKKMFDEYKRWLNEFWVDEKEYYKYIGQWLQPSLDRFHGWVVENLHRLQKILDVNMDILERCSFDHKRFMNINMMRAVEFDDDIQNTFNLICFLINNWYDVSVMNIKLDGWYEYIEWEKQIAQFIIDNISIDYFLLNVKKNWKELLVRVWLNDLYKVWKATKLESNKVHKKISNIHTNMQDLQRRTGSFTFKALDCDGNLFIDSFSMYTGKFVIADISKDFWETDQKSIYNPILIELQNYWLKRVFNDLLFIFPELKNLEYIVFEDILNAIFEIKGWYEALFLLCLRRSLLN